MEEIEEKENMYKQLLEHAKLLLCECNKFYPDCNLTIQEEKEDISDVFICTYDECGIGLFETLTWCSKKKSSPAFFDTKTSWNAGTTYIGIDNQYVGMKITHCGKEYLNNYWNKDGTRIEIDGKVYIINCQMTNAISFEDVRFLMLQDGLISSDFERGKASSEEINDVLSYAYKYFYKNQEKSKKLTYS